MISFLGGEGWGIISVITESPKWAEITIPVPVIKFCRRLIAGEILA